jgi:hypothetical protein
MRTSSTPSPRRITIPGKVLRDAKSRAPVKQLPSRPAVQEPTEAYFAEVNRHDFVLEKHHFDGLLVCSYGGDVSAAKHLTQQEI